MLEHSVAHAVLLVAVVITFVGCEAGEDPASAESVAPSSSGASDLGGDSWEFDLALVDLSSASDEQRDALSDGVLTRQEYRDGFERFQSCTEESGARVNGGVEDRESGRISYSYPAERSEYATGEDPLVKAVEDCYKAEWREIDATFQTSNPVLIEEQRQGWVDMYEAMIRPCLEKNGIDAPDVPPDFDDDEATGAVIQEWEPLYESGRCD